MIYLQEFALSGYGLGAENAIYYSPAYRWLLAVPAGSRLTETEAKKKMKLTLSRGGVITLALSLVLGVASTVLSRRAVVNASAVVAPRFEVDPFWPKPLPNHWISSGNPSASPLMRRIISG